MRLRFGTTESVLLVAGFLGLLEQEIVRVGLGIDPSSILSGICFAFVLIGSGVTVSRNFKIGPVSVALEDEEPERPVARTRRVTRRRDGDFG